MLRPDDTRLASLLHAAWQHCQVWFALVCTLVLVVTLTLAIVPGTPYPWP